MPSRQFKSILALLGLLCIPAFSFSNGLDSLRKPAQPKEVRNYIRPALSFSFFSTGARPLHGNVPILNNRLGKYKFMQSSLAFYTPIYTKTGFAGKDSSEVNTFHLLLTINALTDRPEFEGLEKQHKLYKTGIGLRGIWTFKSNCIIFADINPFVTGDKYDRQRTARYRMGSTLVFNYMVSPKFSFRIGATKKLPLRQ